MSTDQEELSDLKLFHDPFSESVFRTNESGGWLAEFERHGTPISLRKEQNGKIFCNRSGDVVAGNFKSLLAGKNFANLEYLARSLEHEYRDALDNWMEVPFSIDRTDEILSSFAEVDSFLQGLWSGGVVGLEGPAGAGKTHFIERLTALRAQQFLKRDSVGPILIPVTSAGKVLSAVDDRIDGAFSALRASFNRSEMPVLMRHGLISLAIDGFDELSDSRGYDNSWSALRDLFQDIGGSGLVLLSGRDSFISAEELKKLIGQSVALVGADLHSIRIDFPSSTEACNWICVKNSQWNARKTELEVRLDDYYWLRRPFFVSQVSAMQPDAFLESGDEPIVALCDSIVEREVHKLGLPAKVPTANGKKLVYSILTEAARTMMDYEVGFVDASLLEIAVEIACEEILPGEEDFARALSARAKTLTLLEPAHGSGDRDNRMFAHEKIKAFFYARHLLNEFLKDGPAPTGLRRNQLTLSDLSVFSALSLATNSLPTVQILKSIRLKSKDEVSGSVLSSNFAALEIACFSSDELKLSLFSNITIVDAFFPDQTSAIFRDVYINRLDASDADLSGCEFSSCSAGEVIVSEATRFGKSAPKALKLIKRGFDGRETHFHDSTVIATELEALSAVDVSSLAPVVPKTLNILARLMLKGHWVRLEQDDHRGKRLLEREDWALVSQKLTEAGFLETRNIGAGGGPGDFVHLKNAEDFLTGKSTIPAVHKALQELRSL
ncbi:ATP-binding protein [Sulfitobacter sp. S223]|uniref:ATP-binding protein n=1 Tax=Sulfitobacter sp. S223 TaxID=2867023 RepID=UPI0021A4D288|nr:ATP-binding protein [Sulfitobacter sp. S223]UWR26570.1 ATP-binding protein [Sulfitobacter sp. S223]